MTQPILSIEEDTSKPSPKAVANLLPCRVHHDGPVDPLDGYWKPTNSEGAAGYVSYHDAVLLTFCRWREYCLLPRPKTQG
jgi:hypothetical protein